MSGGKRINSVDAYLAGLPKDVKGVLEDLRKVIKTAAPLADEVMSYGIPTCRYHGALVHFVVGKKHCSLITASKSIMKKFNTELKGYKKTETTIHFSVENPLPETLVRKIVMVRVKENTTKTNRS